VDDLFSSPDLFSNTAPPHRLETTVASPPKKRTSSVVILPVWAWVSPLRATITVVCFAGCAWWYFLPGWQIVAFPLAAVACQCIRRWAVLRWTAWSLILASFGAGVLALGTWPLRFAACFLLAAPFLFFAGAELRRL
jgi:hypothetical protein